LARRQNSSDVKIPLDRFKWPEYYLSHGNTAGEGYHHMKTLRLLVAGLLTAAVIGPFIAPPAQAYACHTTCTTFAGTQSCNTYCY
jgi:hypothetical protein